MRIIVYEVQIFIYFILFIIYNIIYIRKVGKMTVYDIGWCTSVILWLIFFILMVISDRRGKEKDAIMFNLCQFIMLIPMWGFLIIGR